MSVSITSVIGLGVRIDIDEYIEATGLGAQRYDEAFLPENKFPLLSIERAGFALASNEELWIFVEYNKVKIYMSNLKNGNDNWPIPSYDWNDPDLIEGLAQLRKWQEYGNQELFTPKLTHIMWHN